MTDSHSTEMPSLQQLDRAPVRDDDAADCTACGAPILEHFKRQGARRLWIGCRPGLVSAQRAQQADQVRGLANVLLNLVAARRGLLPARSVVVEQLDPAVAAMFLAAARRALASFDYVTESVARHRATTAAQMALLEVLPIEEPPNASLARIVAERALAAYHAALEEAAPSSSSENQKSEAQS